MYMIVYVMYVYVTFITINPFPTVQLIHFLQDVSAVRRYNCLAACGILAVTLYSVNDISEQEESCSINLIFPWLHRSLTSACTEVPDGTL